MRTVPQIGWTMPHPHTGEKCWIVKVYRFGTVDIETADGRRFRVTGLGFIAPDK